MYLPNYGQSQPSGAMGTGMAQSVMKKKKKSDGGWRDYLPSLVEGFGKGGAVGAGASLLGNYLTRKKK